MIPNIAVKAFLARPRKNFAAYNDLSDAQLKALASKLPAPIPLWSKLLLHQKACAVIGARTKRFYYIADTGTGKTLLALVMAVYFRRTGDASRILVLVKRDVNKGEWEREIRTHMPGLSYVILRGTIEERWNTLQTTDKLVVIESYSGLYRLACPMAPEIKRGRATGRKTRKGKVKMRRVPDKRLVGQLARMFQGLMMDESTEVKNKSALAYRICNQLSKTCNVVFSLTGTPFGRNVEDIWSQMYLVDRGYTLGETIGLFRAAFSTEKFNDAGFKEWHFDERKKGLLRGVLANRSIVIPINQADLPALVPILKHVRLPTDAQSYYERAWQAMVAAQGNWREQKNMFIRMRQISSGFVGFTDDETGAKAQYVFPENPKLDMLTSIVDSIPPPGKIIIFYDYTWSGRSIVERLKRELGMECLWLWGGMRGNSEALLHEFVRAPQGRQVPLVMQTSFGFGLNLQVAQYGIFYECPLSPIVRIQDRRRFERQGSGFEHVFQYDLLTEGTQDENILNFVTAGEDLMREITRGRAAQVLQKPAFGRATAA